MQRVTQDCMDYCVSAALCILYHPYVPLVGADLNYGLVRGGQFWFWHPYMDLFCLPQVVPRRSVHDVLGFT